MTTDREVAGRDTEIGVGDGPIYLALVSLGRHTTLAAGASKGARYVAAKDGAHFLAILEKHEVGVAIFDPERMSGFDGNQQDQIFGRFRTAGWAVLYDVGQTSEGFNALVSAVKSVCPLDVILRPRQSGAGSPYPGDPPDRIQQVMAFGMEANLGMAVVARIAGHLGGAMSLGLKAALLALLLGRFSVESPADIERCSGCSKSTVRRELIDAGLATSAHFVIAARVLRALLSLRDPSISLSRIARDYKFGVRPTLHAEVEEATGLDVDAIRSGGLPLSHIVERIATQLMKRDSIDF